MTCAGCRVGRADSVTTSLGKNPDQLFGTRAACASGWAGPTEEPRGFRYLVIGELSSQNHNPKGPGTQIIAEYIPKTIITIPDIAAIYTPCFGTLVWTLKVIKTVFTRPDSLTIWVSGSSAEHVRRQGDRVGALNSKIQVSRLTRHTEDSVWMHG